MLINSPENKQKILHKFLEIAAFEGWCDKALILAFKACEIDEKLRELIFENGPIDIADFYISSYNEKAAEQIFSLSNFSEQKIRDKIRLFLYARFDLEFDNKIALQRLANFYLDIKNFRNAKIGARPLFHGLKACYEIADFMWKEIGDASTDFNYYTKRVTLAKIILRSFKVFLSDESAELKKTKAFIDCEIAKVMKFEKFKISLKNNLQNICKEVIFDDSGAINSPKKILQNLPFIRLIKF